MSAQCSPSDKITEVIRPVSLQKIGEDEYEVDFGKEIAGWIHLKDISGTAGDTLTVNYISESPQGNQRYIFAGNGKESYRPRFSWFAFSKARIRGAQWKFTGAARHVKDKKHSLATFCGLGNANPRAASGIAIPCASTDNCNTRTITCSQ